MAANNDPIWVKTPGTPVYGVTLGTSIVSDTDGTGANNVLLFTAGSEGAFITKITLMAKGTNAVGVVRVYINSGQGANTTAANNHMIAEVGLPASTASTTVAAAGPVVIPIMDRIEAGAKIYAGISAGAALASGWSPRVWAGQY